MERRHVVTLGVLLLIVAALCAWLATRPARLRAQDACRPVLLCAYPGGAGGVGGAGAGGGAAGGGGTPGGGLVVDELTLSRRVITAGQTLEGEVTVRNTGTTPIALREVRIAARGPGATHAGGPYTDLAPVLTAPTIPAGGHVTLSASRAFSTADTRGVWEAYVTHQDAAGGWHDAPSERFGVLVGGDSGGGGGDGETHGMTVGTQEWFIAPWAGTHVFKEDINWASAYSSGADIWNPQFLAELQGFALFRHMDTNAVNWSDISRWSQRKLPTDPRNAEVYIDGSSPADTTGWAVEWQIDLCNRAHVDCWFTVPYLADDDYIRQQATLIKAKLDPNATVYIELSNEVWNGSFSAYNQAIQAGQALGLPGSNQYYIGISHEVYRALQMFEVYQSVFGASAMGGRVIRVFSESGNLDLTTQALRNVYESSQWNPHGQRIDMLAMAPYIGNGTPGSSETLTRWKSEVDDKVEGDIAYAYEHHVTAYDLPLFGCYEGGMHHTSSADAWARNSDAYDGYTYMLDRFAERMNGPCTLYTLHGTWDSGGAWGLYDHVGQPIAEAPKARGVKDWIAGTRATTTTTVTTIALVVFVVLVLLLLVAGGLRLYAARTAQRDTPTPPPPPTSPPPPEPPTL